MKKDTALLKQVDTVSVPAVKKFVARDAFKKDTSSDALVKIAFLGENFQMVLLDKVEKNVPAMTLAIYNLEKESFDGSILTELGSQTEIFLAHICEFLKMYPRGRPGTFISYARDIEGTEGDIWVVRKIWDRFQQGWRIHAYSTRNAFKWGMGYQVIAPIHNGS